MNEDKELEDAKQWLNDFTNIIAINKQYTITEGRLEKVQEATETVLKELKRYKRLAEANLKDSEEFKNNMCEHRCILKSELQELKENSIPKKKIENEIEILKAQCGGNVFHIQQTLNAKIRLLQELLED